ncbi:MAG TPA: MarR family transcriptional regulator [Chthonomonadaceae bacterium]|nr:MarR family transcriptional regulator [Chthonomonadaceae bacterium]
MTDETIEEQAACLEALIPRLMRRLFTLDPNHPSLELPLAQLRLCSVLQSGPRTLSGVSEELGISLSAVTQLADRLERAGLVERVHSVEDRRLKNLQLTAQGAEIMRTRRVMRTRGVARALEKLSPEERANLQRALQALQEATLAANQKETPTADILGSRLEL